MLLRLVSAIGMLSIASGISDLALAQVPERLTGHGGPVMAIRLSPDGTEALSASFDYSVIHWAMNGTEGQILHRMDGHLAAVNDVAFVPGGRSAVSVSDDGSLGIWDLDAGTMTARIEGGPEKAIDVDVSSDGALAAAARWDKTARLYDIAKAKEVARLEGHRGNVNAVQFSVDGKTLYTGSYDGTIRAWEVKGSETGESGRIVYSHGWGINVLAAIPGSRLIAFGATDGVYGTLDPATGEIRTLELGEAPILSLSISPDGKWLAAGSANGSIWLIDADDGRVKEEYDNIHGPVWDIAFSRDGDILYHSGLDDFVASWQFDPRQVIEPVKTIYPRRFQATDTSDPGSVEFQRKCSVCHTLEPDGANRAGPTLYGLIGRKAGTVPGYAYSPALANSDIVWTEETISTLFAKGPDVFTPGSKMPTQVLKSVERRDALIEFLKKATTSQGVPKKTREKQAAGGNSRP